MGQALQNLQNTPFQPREQFVSPEAIRGPNANGLPNHVSTTSRPAPGPVMDPAAPDQGGIGNNIKAALARLLSQRQR